MADEQDEQDQQDHDTALLPFEGVGGLPAITIPVTDTMMEAAALLRDHLPERQYNALFESIVHVASMELTDADFGIVDADPVDDHANT